jgi:hypothetical protein
MALDERKGRAMQLGFKRSTSGLTPDEEKELDDLNKELAMENRLQAKEQEQKKPMG